MIEDMTIFVRGLELEAYVGLYPHERAAPQPIRIDVEVSLEPRQVRRFEDTVDYARLAAFARDILADGHIDLVETLADALARRCLTLPGAKEAVVRIEKPLALKGAAGAGVQLRRRRAEGTDP